jgi:hypothetical protein
MMCGSPGASGSVNVKISPHTAATTATSAKAPVAKPYAAFALSLKDAKAKAAEILRTGDPASAKALEQLRDLSKSIVKTRQDARDAEKTRARETVSRLREQFKLIKKIYANNPPEMARQLGKIFKELKAALKVYAEANKGDVASAPAAPQAGETTAPKAVEPEKVEGRQSREDMRAAAKEAAQAYMKQSEQDGKVERTLREEKARGTLTFIDEVRGFVKAIRATYDEAKIKAALLGKGRDERSEPFKDTDKALKELDEAMTDMERDAKAELPLPAAPAALTA